MYCCAVESMRSRSELVLALAGVFFVAACQDTTSPSLAGQSVSPFGKAESIAVPTPDPCAPLITLNSELTTNPNRKIATMQEVKFFQSRLLDHLDAKVDKPFWKILKTQAVCQPVKGITVSHNPWTRKEKDGAGETVEQILSNFTYDIETEERRIYMTLATIRDKHSGKITYEQLTLCLDPQDAHFNNEKSNRVNVRRFDANGLESAILGLFRDPPNKESLEKDGKGNSISATKQSEMSKKRYLVYASGLIQLTVEYT